MPKIRSLKKLSREEIETMRTERSIAYSLYNEEGQVLVHKTECLNNTQIERILRFVKQGIYQLQGSSEEEPESHHSDDVKDFSEESEDTLSASPLIEARQFKSLTGLAGELFNQLGHASLTPALSQKTGEMLRNVFLEFISHPDFMLGSLRTLGFLHLKPESYLIDMTAKRTLVAMAMKARSFSQVQEKHLPEQVLGVMLGSFFCDISYAKMDIPERGNLTKQELGYIQNHPVISYMMVAHDPNLPDHVKQSILLHHHPLNNASEDTNGYPSLPVLVDKLANLQEKNKSIPERGAFCDDVQKQLRMLQSGTIHEDAPSILALSSAFASLSTDVPWRKGFPPKAVVRRMINQSLFSYTAKTMQEFLDRVAMSLCANEPILTEGSYTLVAVCDRANNILQYELAKVLSVSHLQSKPKLSRLGQVKPVIRSKPYFYFDSLGLDNFVRDPRNAYYDLRHDSSRRIVYLLDPNENAKECAFLDAI